MATHQTLPSNSFEQWRQNTNATDIAVGDITTLTTTDKSSLVAAINEIDAVDGNLSSLNTTDKSSMVAAVNEVNNKVGTLSSLNTTNKTNTVAAINEVKATAADDAFLNALLFGGD